MENNSKLIFSTSGVTIVEFELAIDGVDDAGTVPKVTLCIHDVTLSYCVDCTNIGDKWTAEIPLVEALQEKEYRYSIDAVLGDYFFNVHVGVITQQPKVVLNTAAQIKENEQPNVVENVLDDVKHDSVIIDEPLQKTHPKDDSVIIDEPLQKTHPKDDSVVIDEPLQKTYPKDDDVRQILEKMGVSRKKFKRRNSKKLRELM